MGRIEVRLIGCPKDLKAFSEFLGKVAESISALEVIQPGANKPARNSTDALRYMKVDFDTDAYEQSGLKD